MMDEAEDGRWERLKKKMMRYVIGTTPVVVAARSELSLLNE